LSLHVIVPNRPLACALAAAWLVLVLGSTSVHAETASWGDWRPYPERPGLYRERCARCHGEAGTFAKERLGMVDGVLRSRRSGRAVRVLLRGHPGAPDLEEISALVTALGDIVQGGGQFERRCAICHGSARSFASRQLLVSDGRVQGRWSGRDVERYLGDHARLDATGAAFFTVLLRRLAPRGATRPRPGG